MRGESITQDLVPQDVLNNQAVNNTSVRSVQPIDMQKFTRAIYVIVPTSLGAAGTLDGRLQSCANSNFNAGIHNISGTNLTQVLTASTPGNNGVSTIEVSAQVITNANPGDRYLALQLTGGGNSINVGAVGLGGQPVQKPATQYNLNNTFLSQSVVVAN